ncbi:MAG: twin-arginine translocase subunit TatC [Luteitalea sp.]|nr:twin-arginine translocase subunit TatC [Luteitalea sp.]
MALAPVPTRPGPLGPVEPDEDPDLGGKMSFLEHLDELRTRLIRSLAALIVGFLIALAFIPEWDLGRVRIPGIEWDLGHVRIPGIFRFIMEPLTAVLKDGDSLIYTVPTETLFLQLKMAALVGLILALPVVMWQVWRFVAPGLYSHERRMAVPFVVLTTTCFVGGALFSHYIAFPVVWEFFAGYTTDFLTFLPNVAAAFSLYVRLMLGLGVVFEMPAVVFFLARIGLVTPRFLTRNFKYAVLIILVIAALVTPPDPVSQMIVALPMIGLYGLSILIAWVFRRRDG